MILPEHNRAGANLEEYFRDDFASGHWTIRNRKLAKQSLAIVHDKRANSANNFALTSTLES